MLQLKKQKLRWSKSTFCAEKKLYAGCPALSLVISVQFTGEVFVDPKTAKIY